VINLGSTALADGMWLHFHGNGGFGVRISVAFLAFLPCFLLGLIFLHNLEMDDNGKGYPWFLGIGIGI